MNIFLFLTNLLVSTPMKLLSLQSSPVERLHIVPISHLVLIYYSALGVLKDVEFMGSRWVEFARVLPREIQLLRRLRLKFLRTKPRCLCLSYAIVGSSTAALGH